MPPDNLYAVLSAPLGDLIAEVGRGVADAQQAMDNATLSELERIYTSNEQLAADLRALGYRPTWYHIPSAEAELQVALKLSGSVDHRSGTPKRALTTFAAPVDAGYRNSYDYDITAASKLRFTIVPIPEPAQLEGRDVVPAVEGLSLLAAGALLDRLGITYAVSDDAGSTGVVRTTDPPAGTLLEADQMVRLLPHTSPED